MLLISSGYESIKTIAMSRKDPPPAVARLSCTMMEPPRIDMISKTSSFALESLDENLHLPSPDPKFNLITTNTWYSGVQMTIVSQAINVRFQTIRNAVLQVSVYNNGSEVFKQDTKTPTDILPQKPLSLIATFLPTKPGEVQVHTKLTYTFENVPGDMVTKTFFRIVPSLTIETRPGSPESQLVEVRVKNELTWRITNVNVTGQSGESAFIADYLDPISAASALIKMEGAAKDIRIGWALPFCARCNMNAPITQPPRPPSYPFLIKFDSIPKVAACYTPFVVKASVTNKERVALGCRIILATDGCIVPHGPAAYDIDTLAPGATTVLDIPLVGLVEGSSCLPEIVISLTGLPPIRMSPSEGVILTGA